MIITLLAGSESPSAMSAILGLQTFGVPYISYTTSQSLAFQTLPLNSTNGGNFSMILLGSGTIAFSADQWSQIFNYQSTNNVRLVSFYDDPGYGASLNYTTASSALSGNATVYPVSTLSSSDAGLGSNYSIVYNIGLGTPYPAKIVNTAAVSPLLTFSDSTGKISVAACIYNFTASRQQLSFFYQTASWDGNLASNTPTSFVNTLSSYTNAVWINWASKGVFKLTAPAPDPPVQDHSVSVQSRALILSPGDGSESYPQSTFQAYGLDYDTVIISSDKVGTTLNLEITSNSVGRYSTIVLASGQMIASFANGSFLSTLYSWQWKQLYSYQQYYGVRLVAINDIPTSTIYANKVAAFNSKATCDSATSLSVTPANSTFTDAAGMKSTWTLKAGDGIAGSSCNFPATVINSSVVTPVLNFYSGSTSAGVAAAVIDFGRNQQQMSFFMPCGNWSITCCSIGNIWFQWATYGVYTGMRRIYFTPQVDDFFLSSDGLNENNQEVNFRDSMTDIFNLVPWMSSFNSRMPKGSNVTLELAFNGNGILETVSTTTDFALDFDPDLTDTALNWKKPLGTGLSLWPALSTINQNWGTILQSDSLYQFVKMTTIASKFLWVSHTFTHEILNNNSYSDTMNEVTFNFKLASSAYMGLNGKSYWSNKTMVTPGISGLFNGDALRALSDFGIKAAVGDSSRMPTMNALRPMYWPLVTTMNANGFDGFVVIPRQALNIYFNCTNQNYNAVLYNNVYKFNPPKTFADIMNAEVQRNMRNLALLSWSPAMFHQANLRNSDLPTVTAGSATGKLGLAQQWVECVFGNFTQVFNWPILTIKQDDLTQKFINRQIYETAGVTVMELFAITASTVMLNGFTVSANTSCIAPITLPRGVSASNINLPAHATTEQIGIDSLTVWITITANSAPISISLKTAVNVLVSAADFIVFKWALFVMLFCVL
ncbi:hypothetical protein HDU83_009950 [Entophlyctis luteolus]|nr:hypothetical protein HDU83_009950 [Entophlyctis luteolus]